MVVKAVAATEVAKVGEEKAVAVPALVGSAAAATALEGSGLVAAVVMGRAVPGGAGRCRAWWRWWEWLWRGRWW